MSKSEMNGAAIGELIAKLKKPPRSPKEMDRELVRDLMPQLFESTVPRDQIRVSVAIERVWKYRSEMSEEMGVAAQFFSERHEALDKNLAQAKGTIDNLNARLRDTESELRAAREQRGVYESARVAELEKQLRAQQMKLEEKGRAIEQASAQLTEARNGVLSLQAELEARKAQAAGYERDIAQLTTASAAGAESSRTALAQARQLMGEARDKIDDRWGAKLTPYIEAIRNDIVNALKALP